MAVLSAHHCVAALVPFLAYFLRVCEIRFCRRYCRCAGNGHLLSAVVVGSLRLIDEK
jgi:hypothetical protein